MIFISLLTLSLILIIILYYLKNDDIPGPLRVPILGNLRVCMSNPSQFINLLNYYRNVYGDAYVLYLFNARYVFISHPKYIKPLLSSKEYVNKGKPYEILEGYLGKGILTDGGTNWKGQRKFFTPAFHYHKLQKILPIFLKYNKILINIFEKHTDGTPFDVFPIMSLVTLDNVAEFAMGVEVDAQTNAESKYAKAIEDITRILAYRIQNPIVGNDYIFQFMSIRRVFEEALDVFQHSIKRLIKQRSQELHDINDYKSTNNEFDNKNYHTLLDLMLLSKMNGSKMDDENITNQINTFMFTGHDTATSAAAFTLFCLSKHEDVQQKLYEEQRGILGGHIDRDPTYPELQQMRYLENVIKETLRIYPAVPLIERFIPDDINLGGLHIKKNTSIYINILELHRNHELYDNPMEFRPERFESSNTSESAFSWMPFSSGPRNCIGSKFAMMELKVIVSCLIKHFKLLPVDHEPQLALEVILKSINGLKVKLERRK